MNANTEKNKGLDIGKGGLFSRFIRKLDAVGRTEPQISPEYIEKAELLDCVRQAKEEWEDAQALFEYARDQEIIDYCTYKIKACEARYQYFLRKAKEMNINL